jgi:hypothetical protein
MDNCQFCGEEVPEQVAYLHVCDIEDIKKHSRKKKLLNYKWDTTDYIVLPDKDSNEEI